jgi:hypothetical protein
MVFVEETTGTVQEMRLRTAPRAKSRIFIACLFVISMGVPENRTALGRPKWTKTD